jgi:hypothetical protein
MAANTPDSVKEAVIKAPPVAETPKGSERCALCGERMAATLTQNRFRGIWYYVHTGCAYRYWNL